MNDTLANTNNSIFDLTLKAYSHEIATTKPYHHPIFFFIPFHPHFPFKFPIPVTQTLDTPNTHTLVTSQNAKQVQPRHITAARNLRLHST
jgi:hypothetical protein